MAEQIDIGNVGGGGVASEVTLARLTATMELMAKKKGVNPADITAKMQKVMDESSKHVKENSQAKETNTEEVKKSTSRLKQFNNSLLGIAGSIVGTLGTSLSGFAGSLMKGSDQLADYASHVPVFGGALAGLASIIDTNIGAFRDLSNVGAVFGDGLNDIRRISANAQIPLAEFQELVGSNAERMKYFGATTAAGATAFATMSKNLKNNFGRELMNLGFTATELNEALLDYSEYNATQMGADRRSNRLNAKSASEYLKTLDELASVTGKRRDQIRDEMNANMQDQRVRAATAKMTAEQSTAFNAALTQAGMAGPALKEAIIDMADGVANDPFTAMLRSRSETFRRSAENLENMTTQQRNNFFVAVAEEADAYARGLGDSLDGVLGSTGPAADLARLGAEMAGKYTYQSDEQAKAAAAAANLEAQRAEGLKTFHDTIRNITTGLQTILTNQKMGDDGKPIAGSSILERMTAGFSAVADTLGDFIASPVFTEGIANLTQNIQAFIDNFSKFGLGTALFGGEEKVDTPGGEQSVQVKGLVGDLFGEGGTFDGILQSAMEGIKDGISRSVVNFGASLFDFNLSWDEILVGGIAGLGLLIAAPVIGIPGAIAAAIIAVIGYDKLVEGLGVAWDAISGVWTGITEWWDSLDFMAPITSTWDAISGVWTGITDWWDSLDFMTPINNVWDTITGFFSMDTLYSIGDLASSAWDTITGFFSMDTLYSIGDLASSAWNTVTGWFGFGEGEASFGISQLATDAWNTVTGWFGFGEGEAAYSISGIASSAWDTVKGWFSFDNFEFPSITGLFDTVWEKLTGFFDFDFELPSFKSFLPAWMGGGDDNNTSQSSNNADPSVATDGANTLMNAQTAMASFANIEGLENNLNAIKNGLDTDNVISYTEAMKDLVEVLEQLNDELAADNKVGYGTGENAGSVLSKMNTIGSGGSGNNEQLNNTMQQVLTVLTAIKTGTDITATNTRNIVGSNLARSSVSNIGY